MNITLKFTWYFKKEGDQVVVSLNPSLASIFYFFLSMFSPKWDKKWVLACQNFGVRTVRVKLEFTVIRRYAQSWKLRNEIEICN